MIKRFFEIPVLIYLTKIKTKIQIMEIVNSHPDGVIWKKTDNWRQINKGV